MKIISVPDMMCENCVKRITAALTEAKLTFSVSLPEKQVVLDGDDRCTAAAITALEDLGFTPEAQ